jgi:hypothetical protein
MPVRGLDDLDRRTLERELRGAVYMAERGLWRAEKGGDAETIKRARDWLAECYRRARSEKITPFSRTKR